MRRADIKIGERYLTDRRYPTYGAVVRVLEVGVPRSAGYRSSKVADGVRAVVVETTGTTTWGPEIGSEKTLATRNLERLWTDQDDVALAETRREQAELEVKVQQARALVDKLPISAAVRDNGSLFVHGVDDVLALLAMVAE